MAQTPFARWMDYFFLIRDYPKMSFDYDNMKDCWNSAISAYTELLKEREGEIVDMGLADDLCYELYDEQADLEDTGFSADEKGWIG